MASGQGRYTAEGSGEGLKGAPGGAARPAAVGSLSVADSVFLRDDGIDPAFALEPASHVRLVGHDAVTEFSNGNHAVIDHGGGWRTIYAHLK